MINPNGRHITVERCLDTRRSDFYYHYDGQLVGIAPTMAEAERRLGEYVYNKLTHAQRQRVSEVINVSGVRVDIAVDAVIAAGG